MITEIGIVAGEIWQYLDHNGESMFSNMIKQIERNRDVMLMSIGWLAREGHIILNQENNDYRLKLRKE